MLEESRHFFRGLSRNRALENHNKQARVVVVFFFNLLALMTIFVSWHDESHPQISSLFTYPANIHYLAKVTEKSNKCFPSDGENWQLSSDGNSSVPDKGIRDPQVSVMNYVYSAPCLSVAL